MWCFWPFEIFRGMQDDLIGAEISGRLIERIYELLELYGRD